MNNMVSAIVDLERHNYLSTIHFLDFSKAFDKVNHTYHKLNFYGIRAKVLSWVEDLLSDRYQSVIIEGFHSSTSRVPQGSVLAPLLFLRFINDLPENIKNKIKLYADDVLLYTTINSLKADLSTVEQWANR